MLRPRYRSLRTDHLYPLLALVCIGCLGALIPIGPVDFWWHLALGRDISQLGAVPRVSNQSWNLPPNTPFIYGSWLAEWIFFQLYQLHGLSLIVLVRNLLLITSYAIIGIEAWRRSRSWRWAAAAILGAGLIAINNVGVRPQLFAWLPFVLTLLITGAFRSRQIPARTLLLLPLIMIVWVNVHGTFMMGLGILGLSALGETAKLLLRRSDAPSRSQVRWLWSVTLLSAVATLINPRGWMILLFVKNLVGHPIAQQFGGEWQPPSLAGFPGILLPLVLLCIALGWLRHRQRFDLTDALLLAAFTWLGASSIRNLIWFGMVAWPIAAGALAPERRNLHVSQAPLLNYGLALGMCIPLIAVQPMFKPFLDLPPMVRGLGSTTGEGVFISGATPVHAVAWLQSHPLPDHARLFHSMDDGSYLIWGLPDQQVCIDGRIGLYPPDLWMQYRRTLRGENALAELDAMSATHALLQRSQHSELIEILAASGSGWRELYHDDLSIIFEHVAGGAA